jgi:taurine dioxygenase|tara:strand:+ start:203 stop:1057 length:855 start_codon:yes stop_codon:yes gene_type:complete
MKLINSVKSLGGKIVDLDISNKLTQDQINFINQSWDERLVLVFKKQNLDDYKLINFSKYFGELDPPGPNPYGITFLPEFPEINVISNVKNEQGTPIGNLGDGEAVWHADMTYLQLPPKAGILYALEVPKNQGNTHFANMELAYSELPSRLKDKIDGKILIHDSAHNSAGMLRKGYSEVDNPSDTPGARHPMVITDKNTNKKLLFLGRRPHAYIIGLELEESENLLNEIWEHATQDKFTWTQQWEKGDLLMWKNLNVLHKRDAFDPNTRRVMHRTQIKGEMEITA